MKKFLISLFIVAIFSVVVFFIGLGPLRIKPDTIGVVISKTGGIDEKPILNGDLSWYWEFLLPTNAIVKSFTTEPFNITKTVSGELPSGNLYSSVFDSGDGFKYKFTFTISLEVTPENIIELLKQNKISNNDDLNIYLSAAADSVAQFASEFYLKNAMKNPNFRPESVRREQITKNLTVFNDFPLVNLSVFALTECIIPDYTLYKKLQGLEVPELSVGDVE